MRMNEKHFAALFILVLSIAIGVLSISKSKVEVQSTVIGKAVLSELKKLDKIAYLRFASVYRHFEDPGDFAKELQLLG